MYLCERGRERGRDQLMQSHVEPLGGWALLSPIISSLPPLTKNHSCTESSTSYLIFTMPVARGHTPKLINSTEQKLVEILPATFLF